MKITIIPQWYLRPSCYFNQNFLDRSHLFWFHTHFYFFFPFPQEFDKKYNPTWHCIVGRNFGSYVTHETKHFIYFYLGQVAILLFKSGWGVSPTGVEEFRLPEPKCENALVAYVSHTLITTYHNDANPAVRNCMDYTLFNMYVTVSLLFNSCHWNATGVVFVNAVEF